MKYLDAEGTNKNTFSIGVGTEKVELRSINGKLSFRNFAGGYNPVGSETANSVINPRPWVAEQNYDSGELIVFSSILWRVISSHVATTNFLDNLNKVVKVTDISTYLEIPASTGSYSLTGTSPTFVYISGSGGMDLTLPNAISLPLGAQYTIHNGSISEQVNILTNGGADIGSIRFGKGATITLTDNTSFAGTWTILNLGGDEVPTTIIVEESPGLLSVGTIVELDNNGDWVTSISSNLIEDEKFLGIVSAIGASTFTVVIYGEVSLSTSSFSLTTGVEYYLSSTTPGEVLTIPSKYLVFKCVDGTTKDVVFAPRKIDISKGDEQNITQTNTFIPGNAVYVDTDGLWKLAIAGSTEKYSNGVVKAASGTAFTVVTSGVIELTTAQWNAVAGTGSGLAPGVKYFTSPTTPGFITSTEPQNRNPAIVAINSTTAMVQGYISALKRGWLSPIPTDIKTTNYSPLEGELVLTNTTSGAFTITLPASPRDGDKIAVFDVSGTMNSNIITVDRNGKLINNEAANVELKIKYGYYEFLYNTVNGSWYLKTSGGSGGGSSFEVSQANAFVKGSPIYYDVNLNTWELAKSDNITTIANAVVSEPGTPNFIATLSGEIEFLPADITAIIGVSSFVPGTAYYVSDFTAGQYASLSPAISNPMLFAISTNRALVKPGFNALANGTGESITSNTFTSTASQTVFTLDFEPLGKDYVWVSLDGFGEFVNFNISGKDVILTNPLTAGIEVHIRYVRSFKLDTRNNIIPFYEVATASQTVVNLPIVPESSSYVLLWVNGARQFNSYSLVGNVLTFSSPLVGGEEIEGILINAVNFDVAIDNYITRKVVSLAYGEETTVSGVFGENLSGEYRIKGVGTTTAGSIIFSTTEGVEGQLFGNSSNTYGTGGKLNIDFNADTIRIQNLATVTGTMQLAVIREL